MTPPRPARKSEGDDDVMLLLRLGDEAGGRIDPDRILARRPNSPSRLAFMAALDQEFVDGRGFLTTKGRTALAEWSDDADAA